jgi:hypothetical protein
MRIPNTAEKQNEMRDLLEENLKYTKEILKISQKTKKYLFWAQMMSWIKILLIAVPVILGIIYLPPLIKQWQEQVKEILEPIESGSKTLEQIQNNGGIFDFIKTLAPQ